MSLVIEDGSSPSGAESYATVAELRSFATSRGITGVPVGDTACEVLLRKACDFLGTLEGRYKGARTADDQPLSWPRSSVYLFGTTTLFADDEIPTQVVTAQCQLACDAITTELQPLGTGREVIKQKVDVIETEYGKTGGGTVQPEFNKAMGILAPCLNGGGFGVQSVRV